MTKLDSKVTILKLQMINRVRMSLNYYKTETEKVCRSKGWDRAPIDTVWLLLSEEVGELASAIRQYKKMYKKTNCL